jgi:DNA-binding protein
MELHRELAIINSHNKVKLHKSKMYRSKAPISKYRRVPKDTKPAENNEIRIKNNNPAFSYVAYAFKLFFEENEEFVYLNSTGPATSNAIKVVEILRAGIKNLHVQYKIVGTEFVDEYEPLEEGLDRVVETRTISSLQITLTVSQGKEIEGTAGYMEPLPSDDVDEEKFKRDIENYNKRKDGNFYRLLTSL